MKWQAIYGVTQLLYAFFFNPYVLIRGSRQKVCNKSNTNLFSLISASSSFLSFFFFLSTESHFLESQSSRMKKSILAKKINSLPRSYLEKSTQDDSFFLLISLSLEGPVWGEKKEYYIPDNPSPLLLLYNTPYSSKCMQKKKNLKPGSMCHSPKIKDIFSCILNLMCLFFSVVCHDCIIFFFPHSS